MARRVAPDLLVALFDRPLEVRLLVRERHVLRRVAVGLLPQPQQHGRASRARWRSGKAHGHSPELCTASRCDGEASGCCEARAAAARLGADQARTRCGMHLAAGIRQASSTLSGVCDEALELVARRAAGTPA